MNRTRQMTARFALALAASAVLLAGCQQVQTATDWVKDKTGIGGGDKPQQTVAATPVKAETPRTPSQDYSSRPPANNASSVPEATAAATPEQAAMPVDVAWQKLAEEVAAGQRKKSTDAIVGAFVPTVRGMALGTFSRTASRSQASAATRALGSSVSTDAFNQSVDQVAQFLVRELPLDPAIAKSQSKQVLAMEKIENRSGVKNTSLELALDSIHSSLVNSDAIKANFLVLARDTAGAKKALDNAGAGKSWSPTGEATSGSPGFGQYHPASIYQVTGKFYQLVDERSHRLYLKTLVEVWRPLTGETVKSAEITREFRSHPYRLEWISAAEDEALKQRYGGAQSNAR